MYSKFIDHTLLKAFATTSEIEQLCLDAKVHKFKSVCVNPTHVELASKLLEGSEVLVCTVVGFPLGANTTKVKVEEVKDAIQKGADEIDMVINIGKLKDGDYKYIEKEIKEVVNAADGRTVKVIIESCYLNDDEKVSVCKAAKRANAHFVKTSTGFGTGGASIKDVKLMKQSISETMEVKASGGIKTFEEMKALIDAGATRIGTSSGIKLLEGAPNGYSTY